VFLDLQVLNRPEIFSNAFGDSFDAEGNLVDQKLHDLIEKQMQALAEKVSSTG
jgi:chromate reductase